MRSLVAALDAGTPWDVSSAKPGQRDAKGTRRAGEASTNGGVQVFHVQFTGTNGGVEGTDSVLEVRAAFDPCLEDTDECTGRFLEI
jgi:hypothetical protein